MFPHFSRSTTTELQPFQVSSQPPPRSDTSSQCLRWEATVGLWSWDCLRMTQVNSPCFKGPKGGNLETNYNLDLRLGWTFSLCCTRCTCMKNIIIGPAHSEMEWFKCGPSKKTSYNIMVWQWNNGESLIHEWQLDVAAVLRKHRLSAASSETAASRCRLEHSVGIIVRIGICWSQSEMYICIQFQHINTLHIDYVHVHVHAYMCTYRSMHACLHNAYRTQTGYNRIVFVSSDFRY